MHIALWIGLMGLGAGLPDAPSPIAWSPDGRWIAYVQEVRPPARALPDGWLFQAGPPAFSGPNPNIPPSAYRLWATQPETGTSVLLEESKAPLSAPSWSADGASMAFSRIVRGSDGTTAIELVVQDSTDRRRVLHKAVLKGPEPDAARFRTFAPAWSFDGALIAAPRIDPEGLVLVKAETGKVAKTLPGALAASWSPVSNRLAYLTSGTNKGIWVLDGVLVEPRKVAERFDNIASPPALTWDREGRWLQVLRPSIANPNPGAPGRSGLVFQLARIRVDGREAELVVDLSHDPVPSEGELSGVWFSVTPEGEDAFYATASVGQVASQMTWATRRFGEARKRFNPIDGSCLIGAVSAGPDGRGVAFRIWTDGSWSPPAVTQPSDEATSLATPDDASRSDWLARLVAAIGPILSERIPPPSLADGTHVERPSLLPSPGELEPSDPAILRLKRLGRMGLAVVGPPPAGSPETRLALAYLAGDAAVADVSARAMLDRTESIDERLRFRAIEAQIAMMQKDYARAEPLIAYLRVTRTGPSFEIVESLESRQVKRIDDPRTEWARFLAEKLQVLRSPPVDPGQDLVPRDALDLEGLRAPVGGNPPAGAPF